MKKMYCLCFTLVFLLLSSVVVLADWDWTNDYDFFDYYGNQIPSPWYAQFHSGVDLTTSAKCLPSEGWTLYVKRMTAGDWVYTPARNQKSIAPVNPYFALYNRYTGVLRLFIYVGGDNTIGEDYFAFKTSISDGSNVVHPIGLLLNDCGTNSYSLEEKGVQFNQNRVTLLQAVYKKWFVIDYLLSYDPTLSTNPPSNIFLTLNLDAKNISEIVLTGSFQYSATSIMQNGTNTANSFIDTVFGSAGQITKRIKNVTSFKNNLLSDGNSLKSKGLTSLGNALVNAANLITNPVGGIIGLGVAAVDIISSFTNVNNHSTNMTTLTYGDGTIKLDGQIMNNFTYDVIRMGISKVQYTNPGEAPVYQGNLGLFSLKEKPSILIYRDLTIWRPRFQPGSMTDPAEMRLSFKAEDNFLNYQNLVYVNPDSDMEIIEFKVLPVFKSILHLFGYTPANGYHTDLSCLCISGDTFVTQFNSRRLFATLTTEGTIMFPPVSPFVKVYIKFRNIYDQNNIVEVLRTYPANVTYIDTDTVIWTEGTNPGMNDY